jgi:hypothetical protein
MVEEMAVAPAIVRNNCRAGLISAIAPETGTVRASEIVRMLEIVPVQVAETGGTAIAPTDPAVEV